MIDSYPKIQLNLIQIDQQRRRSHVPKHPTDCLRIWHICLHLCWTATGQTPRRVCPLLVWHHVLGRVDVHQLEVQLETGSQSNQFPAHEAQRASLAAPRQPQTALAVTLEQQSNRPGTQAFLAYFYVLKQAQNTLFIDF